MESLTFRRKGAEFHRRHIRRRPDCLYAKTQRLNPKIQRYMADVETI